MGRKRSKGQARRKAKFELPAIRLAHDKQQKLHSDLKEIVPTSPGQRRKYVSISTEMSRQSSELLNRLDAVRRAQLKGSYSSASLKKLERLEKEVKALELETRITESDVEIECLHGHTGQSDSSETDANVVDEFMDHFVDKMEENGGAVSTVSGMRDILTSAFAKYPQCWDDDNLRERVRRGFVGWGTRHLLQYYENGGRSDFHMLCSYLAS